MPCYSKACIENTVHCHCQVQLSSVQMKAITTSSETPIWAPPRLSVLMISPVLPLKRPQRLGLIDDGPFSFLSRYIVERFRFLLLSPTGDRWRGVPGCVSAGSVSSSSTVQTFPDVTHSRRLLCPSICLLVVFSHKKKKKKKPAVASFNVMIRKPASCFLSLPADEVFSTASAKVPTVRCVLVFSMGHGGGEGESGG